MLSTVMQTMNCRRQLASAAVAAASAAQPAVRGPPPSTASFQQKVTQMPDGLTVASVDQLGAISQVAIAFKAGTRYEQSDEAGIVHFLRNIVGTDSSRYSGLKLLWQSGSIGANIQASVSKDLLILQLSVIRTHDKVGISILGELAQPALKQWDVMARLDSLQQDLLGQTPEELVMENLHRAAYRNGSLGTPLMAPGRAIYSHGSAQVVQTFRQLKAYAQSRMVAGGAALVGVNVDHSTLVAYASEQRPVPKGEEGRPKTAASSPYFGGDVRVNGSGKLAHVAIAGQGAKLSDMKSVAVQAVLTAAFGKGPNTKLVVAPATGVVSRHVVKAAHHNPLGLSAINVVHSDTGLAGVYLVARGDQVAPLVRAAIDGFEELAKNGPKAEDLAIAKKSAAVETLVRAESSSQMALDLAAQALANPGGKTVSPTEFIQLIDQVTEADVKKAAQQVLAKLSVSAYGDIHQVPYADVI